MESTRLFSDECACGCGERISSRALAAKMSGTSLGYVKGHTWKNRTMPLAACQKMSRNHANVKGDRNPNFGKGLFGQNNPNWQGGKIKQQYAEKNQPGANTIQDKEFKQQIKLRDQQCIFCYTTENLTVHHIISVVDSRNQRFSEENCVTLCKACHARADNKHHKDELNAKCLEYIRSLYGR